jgi:undecaprenyl-diphosphatase
MVSIFEAVILGIVQGITEWLPISSSGHLVIFQHFFNIKQPIALDLALHIGSLIVVFIVFWKDIVKLTKGVLFFERESLIFALWLVLATIPIALVGLFFRDFVESAFDSIRMVGFGLLITAAFLFLSKYPIKKDKALSLKNTFLMGLSQAVAIIPGVSRSGFTISAGLMQGADKEKAAKFSFLMFIPAIVGATILEYKKFSSADDITAILIGVIVTIIVGIIFLRALLKIVKEGKIHKFGWYCLAAGIFAIALSFI